MKMTKEKLALKMILDRAMNHPAFEEELFNLRDIDALADLGGDIFDWTLTAINAADALKEVEGCEDS